MKLVKKINVELNRKGFPKEIDVVQYDTGLQLECIVKDFDIPDGTIATLYAEKPSGKFVYQQTGIEISDNTIIVDLENQVITEHGKVWMQITLSNGTDTISTFEMLMEVQKSRKDSGAVESTTVIRAFDEAIEKAVAQINEARDDASKYISESVDQSLSIAGKAADAAAVGKKVTELNEKIVHEASHLSNEINDISNGNIPLGLIIGYYLIQTTGNILEYEGWSTTDFIDVSKVKNIYIDWSETSPYNCFYNENKEYISDVVIYKGENIIPIIDGAKYIRLSNATDIMNETKVYFNNSGNYLLKNKLSKNEIIGGELLRGYGWDYLREKPINTCYNEVLLYFKENPSLIPIFISTDNHMYSPQHAQRHVNNIDVDGMEVTNINLGDCVVGSWNDNKFNEIYNNIKYIKNYIGVCGNHDKQNGTNTTEYYLNRIFTTTNFQSKHIKDCNRCCYSVKVEKQSVKYIVLDPYVPIDGELCVSIPTNVANWIIEELTNDKGYDVIILCHSPLTNRNIHRDGSVQTWNDYHEIYEQLFTVLKDRKNKRNGTFTDSDNVIHSYDFTKCTDELLLVLHGHAHEELYLLEDNLLSYVCAGEVDQKSTFIIYDRINKRFKAWVVESNTVGTPLTLNLN